MTEKDKMLAGKAYLAGEEQLVKERQYAKQVLFKFTPVWFTEVHSLLARLQIRSYGAIQIGSNLLIQTTIKYQNNIIQWHHQPISEKAELSSIMAFHTQ